MFLFQPCSLGQCCFLYWSWYPGHALKVLGKYRARPYKRDKEEDKSSYWSIVVILVCGDGPLVLEVNWFMVAGIWHVGADWITRTCLEVRASHLQSWIFLHMCAYFFTDAWSMFVIGQIEWMRFIYESIDEYPQFNRPLCIENRHEFASCWLPGEFTGEDGWSPAHWTVVFPVPASLLLFRQVSQKGKLPCERGMAFVWTVAAGYVSFFGHAQWMDAGYLRARCMVKK